MQETEDIVTRLQNERRATRWTRGVDTDYPVAWEPHPLCAEAATTIATLRAEVEVLRADAERYRWLRDDAKQGLVAQRQMFENWYTSAAFDYSRDPIGSRDCSLQWAAWCAAIDKQKEVNAEEKRRLFEILRELYRTAHHSAATDSRRRLAREALEMLPIPQVPPESAVSAV